MNCVHDVYINGTISWTASPNDQQMHSADSQMDILSVQKHVNN